MHMKKLAARVVAAGLIALTTIATSGTAGAAASSAPAAADGSAGISTGGLVRERPVPISGAPASASSVCSIPTVYGYTGETYCYFFYSTFNWGGGNIQYFAIGTNFIIYTIWKGSGGWRNLQNGKAENVANNGVANNNNPGNLIIDTYGTDGNIWCDSRSSSGSWSGWYRC